MIQIVFFSSCVQKEKCQTNKLGIRNLNLAGALYGLSDALLVTQAENALCPDIDMVCCNDLDVYQDTRNLCSLHSDIFYRYKTKLRQYTNILMVISKQKYTSEIQVTKFRKYDFLDPQIWLL